MEQACQAYAAAERPRRQIQVSGDEAMTANGGTKANPLIAIELQARSLVARLLGRLGVLDTEPKRGPGRPPKVGGLVACRSDARSTSRRRWSRYGSEAASCRPRAMATSMPKADEFRRVDKRLCWTLLQRPPHMVSILDDLDGNPPAYMQQRNTPSHPDFNGWFSGRELQRRL